VLHILSSLIMPLSLLGLAVYIYPAIEILPSSQLELIYFLPLIISVITLSLCLKFNRSLLFFSTLALIIFYSIIQWYIPRVGYVEAKIVWVSLTMLLPFNIMLISLLKERGMLTWWGVSRFAILLLPLFIIMALARYFPEVLRPMLAWQFFNIAFLKQFIFFQPTIVVMVLAILVLNGRWFVQATAQNSALFVALIAAITMLYFKNREAVTAVFACVGLLVLVIAVIQETWSMAYIDQLTGLPGRRALDEELLKLGGNYSIAMMDIDHFKKFNDTYGHDVGDQVLKMVASRIKQSISGGQVFRYGGEEFTIVLPGQTINDTLEKLDFVRSSVGDSKFKLRNKDRRRGKGKKGGEESVQVTISIGVSNRTDDLNTPYEVIKAADKALYKAKKKGRNRVCG
jgi:diguanylate cyclase (GGDEF)-like protein